MAFSKAPRFPGREFSTPGPGAYNPNASPGLPRVFAYAFGPPRSPMTSRHRKQKERLAQPQPQPRPQPPLPQPALPTVDLAKLQVQHVLGQGGLATVKQAVFEGKPVAVKVYRPQPRLQSDRDQDLRALQAEATMLHGIRHPRIVTVVSLLVCADGTINGYIRERLGESLQRAADAGDLCRPRLATAFRTTCEAVGHLHNLLIAHTDIRASNLSS